MDKFHRHEGCELCLEVPAYQRRISAVAFPATIDREWLNRFTERFMGMEEGTLSDKSDAKDEHSHPDWDVCTSECVKWIEKGI